MTSFSELKAWKDAAEKEQPKELTDCPNCGWPLNTHPKTQEKHCPCCGWPSQKQEAPT